VTDKLQKAWDRAWKGAEYRSWVKGVLGRPDGAGGYDVIVPDRPNFYYVRITQSGTLTVTAARVAGSVPARANLPVRLRLEKGSGYVIYGVDATTALDAALADDPANPYGIAQHTHSLDSGMSYLLEAQRLAPGLVRPAGGFSVTVEPFRYQSAGTWQTYEGEDLDLATNQPGTTGKHRLVLVSLDPSTNTVAATNGSDANYATALTQADIDAINVVGRIPLGAVIIRADDADINDHTKFIDARGWLNLPGVTFDDSEGDPATVGASAADGTSDNAARRDHAHAYAYNDAEGQPADIGTTADGVSAWPARRDHVHALGAGSVGTTELTDGTVTNAKLANMAEGTIKGRALSAGTGAPTDLTASQAAAIVGTAALNVNTTAVGNAGTGEDVIATYTIPAGTLAADGDSIWFEAWGTSNDDESDTYTFKIYFGATLIHSIAATNWGSAWMAWGRIVRVGATSQKAFSQMLTNSGYGAGSFGGGLYIAAPAETLSGSVVLAITAEAVNNDDVVCTSFVVGKTPA
jgi:hypothetical protein